MIEGSAVMRDQHGIQAASRKSPEFGLHFRVVRVPGLQLFFSYMSEFLDLVVQGKVQEPARDH